MFKKTFLENSAIYGQFSKEFFSLKNGGKQIIEKKSSGSLHDGKQPRACVKVNLLLRLTFKCFSNKEGRIGILKMGFRSSEIL
jgi:hypothetical protein